MKQYKLIKKFPECRLDIGDIVTQDEYDQYVSEDITIFHQFDVEDYPEFWEPIEKDYDILSIINASGPDRISPYYKNGDHYESKHGYKITCFPDGNHGTKIHSVRRLSDGEVFSVGDEVEFKGASRHNGEIILFKVEENHIRVQFVYGKHKAEGALSGIKHFKQPLFTTEDGVDVYEGDEYYHIHKRHMNLCYNNNAGKYNGTDSDRIYFSTKEKAQEYIDNNKPRYSKGDILKALNSCRNSLYVSQDNFKKELGL